MNLQDTTDPAVFDHEAVDDFKRRRRWPWVLLAIMLGLAAAVAATMSRWESISAYFLSSDLEQAVQTAGFDPIVSHQSGTSNSVESVEAMLGGCQLTFAWGVQPLDDGSSVVRLALVRDDGSFTWGPTPTKLGADPAFSICF